MIPVMISLPAIIRVLISLHAIMQYCQKSSLATLFYLPTNFNQFTFGLSSARAVQKNLLSSFQVYDAFVVCLRQFQNIHIARSGCLRFFHIHLLNQMYVASQHFFKKS